MLIPNVTIFEERAFQEIIGLDEVIWVAPSARMTAAPTRRGRDARDAQAQRKGQERIQ